MVVRGASVVVAAPAAASAQPVWHVAEGGGTYLAIGDSVAFGYDPLRASSSPDYAKASSFASYANDVA